VGNYPQKQGLGGTKTRPNYPKTDFRQTPVDDYLPNVESAQALGIYAIHCIGSLSVQETLNRILSSQPASL
jgi:hypothetical protein